MTAITEEEQRRLDAFLQLTRLERGLRRTLESNLSECDGDRWLCALPPDIREKCDPRGLDYADFPDLKKILGSSWRKLDPITSPLNKLQILSHLEGLEGIRNDLAHSRSVSEGSLAMIAAAYYVVSPLIAAGSLADSMPPTAHPRIALTRIATAIRHSSSVSPDDLGTLPAHSAVCTQAEAYERVRKRPGRSQALFEEVQLEALAAIDTATAAEATNGR